MELKQSNRPHAVPRPSETDRMRLGTHADMGPSRCAVCAHPGTSTLAPARSAAVHASGPQRPERRWNPGGGASIFSLRDSLAGEEAAAAARALPEHEAARLARIRARPVEVPTVFGYRFGIRGAQWGWGRSCLCSSHTLGCSACLQGTTALLPAAPHPPVCSTTPSSRVSQRGRLAPATPGRTFFWGSVLAIWGTAALIAASGESLQLGQPVSSCVALRMPAAPPTQLALDHGEGNTGLLLNKANCHLCCAARGLAGGQGEGPVGAAPSSPRSGRDAASSCGLLLCVRCCQNARRTLPPPCSHPRFNGSASMAAQRDGPAPGCVLPAVAHQRANAQGGRAGV